MTHLRPFLFFIILSLSSKLTAQEPGEFYDFYSKYPKDEVFKMIKARYPELKFPSQYLAGDKKEYKYGPDGYFQIVPVGPLEFWGLAIPGKKCLIVFDADEGGVGQKHGLQPWDEIHGVNGKPFTTEHTNNVNIGEDGPIRDLGEALDVAQGQGGLELVVKRQIEIKSEKKKGPTKTREVMIKLKIPVEKLGRFTPTYPVRCQKSDFYMKEIVKKLVECSERPRYSNHISHGLVGLSLLSYGESSILPAVEDYAIHSLPKEDRVDRGSNFRISNALIGNTWINAFTLIYLSEYFWATGDETVFPTLQTLAYSVSDQYQNPFGASGHNVNGGTYLDYSFGPPNALNILGLALAEKVGCKVDHRAYERYWSTVSNQTYREALMAFGKYAKDPSHRYAKLGKSITNPSFVLEPNKYYGVGYMARLWSSDKPNLGESALNSAAAALALMHAPPIGPSRELSKKLLDHLKIRPHSFSFIHASPALGLFWSSLAISAEQPRPQKNRKSSRGKKNSTTSLRRTGNRTHLDYRKFWITMSRYPDKKWLYFYPKHARMSAAGGGWGGDGYVRMNGCSLFQPLIMLTSEKRNLLLQGNTRRNWLRPQKDPKETLQFIHNYHDFYAKQMIENAQKLLEEKDFLGAYHIYNRISENYTWLRSMGGFNKMFTAFKRKLGPELQYKLKEEEGKAYLAYLTGHQRMDANLRKALFYLGAHRLQGHPFADKLIYEAENFVPAPADDSE